MRVKGVSEPSFRGRGLRIVARILVGIIVAGLTDWGGGAIYYSPIPSQTLRSVLAAFFVAATALAFLLLPNRRRTLAGFVVVFAILVALFFQIPASNERDWQPEVAVTPYATVNGDLVTIHGVMTFIVNHDGVVYEKDLGKNTANIAHKMTGFDPDKSWKKAD